jgi:hypothetical protein
MGGFSEGGVRLWLESFPDDLFKKVVHQRPSLERLYAADHPAGFRDAEAFGKFKFG